MIDAIIVSCNGCSVPVGCCAVACRYVVLMSSEEFTPALFVTIIAIAIAILVLQ